VGFLIDDPGQRIENPCEIENAFVDYFSKLFTSGPGGLGFMPSST
jgi:hypothetical protein